MKLLKIDKSTFPSISKPNKLIVFSLFTVVISNIATILNFHNLDIEIKIIICLSITCFILLIDIVSLYVQYYKYYYQELYINKVYSLIDTNLEQISENLSKIEQKYPEVSNLIEDTNFKINSIKSKSV